MSYRSMHRSPLSVIMKNISRKSTPGRRREKDLMPTPPPLPKSIPIQSEPIVNFMINLEDLLIIEGNLSFILISFSHSPNAATACEELWDLTSDNTLNQVSNLFRDIHKRSAIHYSMALQSTGIAIIHYFISQYKLHHDLSILIKKLIYHIHQAFLILIKFILSRVPEDESNIWVQKLTQILREKKKKTRKRENDSVDILKHHSKCIAINLKTISRGFPNRSEDNTVKALKQSLLQILRNPYIEISEARGLIESAFGVKREGICPKATIQMPALLPEITDKRYTLVLDLDETLVHYIENQDEGQYLTRPFAENFLADMHKMYEIVIFTAAIQDYADWILDDLDSKKLITHRLYRQHTIPAGNFFLKDLSGLSRDLSKVIIVDNVAENFQLQPDNGILIKSWYDDADDIALKELSHLLKEIYQKQVEDVRVALNIFRGQMLEQLSKGVENPVLALDPI